MKQQHLNVFYRTFGVFLILPLLAFACSVSGDGSNGAPTATLTPTATVTPTPSLLGGAGGHSFRVMGESNDVSFSGEICTLEKEFMIEASFPGGSAETIFTPAHGLEGTTEMSGGGNDCTQSGEGTYIVTLNADGTGTITWTDSATLTCPGITNTRTATFELPLEPAPDLVCP